jgi:hypothetical protein
LADYKLDIGDSTKGQIGLCAYVEADSREEAYEEFKDIFGETIEIEGGRYYQNVYLNWEKITVDDVVLSDSQPDENEDES